jgi:hypothetical protein
MIPQKKMVLLDRLAIRVLKGKACSEFSARLQAPGFREVTQFYSKALTIMAGSTHQRDLGTNSVEN